VCLLVFLGLSVIHEISETGLPPSEGLKVTTAWTGRPRPLARATRSAVRAERLGSIVTLTVLAVAISMLPLPKTISTGGHAMCALTWPLLQVLLAEAPSSPSRNVSRQLIWPGLGIDIVKVIAPVAAWPAGRLTKLSVDSRVDVDGAVSVGTSGDGEVGEGKDVSVGEGPTLNDCWARGAALYSVLPGWLASIVHVPAAMKLTAGPLSTHTEGVWDAKAAGNPEDALTETM
jgi:hypothetical protein